MTHYFSRVRLLARPSQNEWLRELARHGDPYRDHALIWKLFPGDGRARDFLFRRLDDGQTYYVVSERPPQGDGLFDVQSKPYSPLLAAGSLLRFDLRANPVVSLRDAQGRSARHDVLMNAKRNATDSQQVNLLQEQAGRDWLQSRAESWGLELSGGVLQEGYHQHSLRSKGRAIRYSSLDYQGTARVQDPERLRHVLLQGAGHAKGFGCGLLLVKRLG